MTGHSEAHSSGFPKMDPLVLREGIVSGIIGAAGIAIWFLIADSIQGRPFYTPSVLGTVLLTLLKGGAGLSAVESVPVSLGMVFMFSVIHGTSFLGIGLLCAWLLHLAEDDASYIFNVLLLLVFFACGFTFLNMVLAGVVLNALSITDIMIAHILAVAAMGYFYWNRHPKLVAQL
jgi:hypothetical protein